MKMLFSSTISSMTGDERSAPTTSLATCVIPPFCTTTGVAPPVSGIHVPSSVEARCACAELRARSQGSLGFGAHRFGDGLSDRSPGVDAIVVLQVRGRLQQRAVEVEIGVLGQQPVGRIGVAE